MTKQEFQAKFPIGSKVRLNIWGEDSWVKILFYGVVKFFACNEIGFEELHYYDEGGGFIWLPYSEPKKTKLVPINFKDNFLTNLYGSITDGFGKIEANPNGTPMTLVIKQPNGVEIEGLCYLKVEI